MHYAYNKYIHVHVCAVRVCVYLCAGICLGYLHDKFLVFLCSFILLFSFFLRLVDRDSTKIREHRQPKKPLEMKEGAKPIRKRMDEKAFTREILYAPYICAYVPYTCMGYQKSVPRS